QWFSGYGMMPPELDVQSPLADRVTHFLVHFFVEGKFYSIFSFLFGFGFALQIRRTYPRSCRQRRLCGAGWKGSGFSADARWNRWCYQLRLRRSRAGLLLHCPHREVF
ncbi:MAG TPA: hypothetical protein VJ715_16380, partial [Pyrinomonadaceae bacterium]|nr:hypothetical protein [Pyrinomonadaceae bacterium]